MPGFKRLLLSLKTEPYKLKRIFFITTALPALLSGMDTFLQHHYFFGCIYMLAGIGYIAAALWVKKLDKRWEAILEITGIVILLAISTDLFLQGKKYLPAVYFSVAVFSGWLYFRRKQKNKAKPLSAQ
jgi:uncharacterized membrane protein HdeD (DUF308 family)